MNKKFRAQNNQTAILDYQILESEQVQENLPEKINQITLNNSTKIEQALNSLKFPHPYSTSRKSDKEISANNLPSKTEINKSPNNLPNNNQPTKSTEIMNLPTNKQVSLRDALEIVPFFDGSSKVPSTIFIEACKEAKEMVPNAEGNLVKLLRRKLTGEVRRRINGNYYFIILVL